MLDFDLDPRHEDENPRRQSRAAGQSHGSTLGERARQPPVGRVFEVDACVVLRYASWRQTSTKDRSMTSCCACLVSASASSAPTGPVPDTKIVLPHAPRARSEVSSKGELPVGC